MRGSRHSDEIRENAYALLASGLSVSAVAHDLGLQRSTVDTWWRAWKNTSSKLEEPTQTGADAAAGEEKKAPAQSNETDGEKTLNELRQEKKRQFVDNSWKIIEGAQQLLERRIERAIHKEDVLDEIVNMVENSALTDEQQKNIIRKLSAIRLDDIRALSSILATCYDKQALASGDPTLNLTGDILKFEDY